MHSSREIVRLLDRKLEMTRRILNKEADVINQELKALPEVEKKIPEFVKALDQDEWEKNEVINHPKMPYYALLAYQEKFIQPFQFATFLLYWSALVRHGTKKIETHILYHDEEKQLKNKALLIKTTQSSGFIRELIPIHLPESNISIHNLSDEQSIEFFDEIKKLPRSEQRFLLVPDIDVDKKNIAQELKQVDFNLFGTCDGQRMIASVGILQAYLNVKFKEGACIVNPVLGLSSINDIRMNGLNDQRDMAIPFPNIRLPEMADYFEAPSHIFSWHDSYHAFMASFIPALHRKLMVKMGDALHDYVREKNAVYDPVNLYFPTNKKIPKLIKSYAEDLDHETVRIIANNFYDMEFPMYRFHSKSLLVTDSVKFWASLNSGFIKTKLNPIIHQTYNQIPVAVPLTDYTKLNLFKKIFEITDKESKDIAEVPKHQFNVLKTLFDIQNDSPSSLENPFYKEFKDGFDEMDIAWQKLHILDIIEKNISALCAKETTERKQSDIIEKSIEPLLDVSNVISVFQMACERKIRKLQQTCMVYMSKHFHQLVRESSFKIFQRNQPTLLKSFIIQMQKSRHFRSVVQTLIEKKESEDIFDLLFLGNVNQTDAYGYVLLDYAIQFGSIKLVEMALNRGASLYPQKDSKTLPSLFAAIYHAQGEIFYLLYQRGFNMNYIYDGLSWDEFFNKCSIDPETYVGFLTKYNENMEKNRTVSLGYHEATLFAKSIEACRKSSIGKEPPSIQDFLKMTEKQREEYAIETARAEMSWSLKRLPKEIGKKTAYRFK